MSNFGPAGGTPDPWDGRPEDGYGPSPGPYYEPPPTRRYEPAAGWEQPVEPPGRLSTDAGYGGQPYAAPTPPKRGRGPLLAVLAVLAVLALAGATAFWVVGRDEPTPVVGAPISPAAEPTAVASEPAEPATTAPAPASSTDPRFVRAGQCVRNVGPGNQPKLVISECGAKTYQVLRRVDGATSGKKDAEAKCAKVAGYTDWYFFDSDLDTLDFVLCLKRR